MKASINLMNTYKNKIKHEISSKTSKELYIPEPMDKSALEFLEEKEYVSRILIGMRKKEYVDKVLSYIK